MNNPKISLPPSDNMLAIIYLVKGYPAEAKDVLKNGREQRTFENAGTDVLLAYTHLATRNLQEALYISDHALTLLGKILSPRPHILHIVAHNLAIATMARGRTSEDDAFRMYGERMKAFDEPAQKTVAQYLMQSYGTLLPNELAHMKPTRSFSALKHLTQGTYKDASE